VIAAAARSAVPWLARPVGRGRSGLRDVTVRPGSYLLSGPRRPVRRAGSGRGDGVPDQGEWEPVFSRAVSHQGRGGSQVGAACPARPPTAAAPGMGRGGRGMSCAAGAAHRRAVACAGGRPGARRAPRVRAGEARRAARARPLECAPPWEKPLGAPPAGEGRVP